MILTRLPSLPLHSLSYQGHVSAALVLGGVDVTGPHLYTVWPHGRFVHSWFSCSTFDVTDTHSRALCLTQQH